ncbi:MAG: hypothetical protein F6K41_08435 [Symploca sp. SIO3E6]|nr:hypothetical protein [Caldora sp. SIO3E6]
MNMTDEQLQGLITRICQHPDSISWERRQAINRLLIRLQQLPGLLKSPHLDYLEALDKTWEWVSRNICQFEPRLHLSIQESLVKWINGYLRWRIKDLYQQGDCQPYSIDNKINNNGEISTTLGEQISETGLQPPVLSGIDGYIEQRRNQKIQQTALKLELYILEDPQGRLKSCHPRNRPDCNCQFLSQRLLFQDPPQRFSDISRELGINRQTLKSHWERKCKPLLQEIAVSLGYSKSKES